MIAVAVFAVAAMPFWPGAQVASAQAAPDGTYRDSVAAAGYSGSDGSLDWSGSPWTEIGESDGATSGSVRAGFVSSPCLAGGRCLRINDTSSGTSFGLQRTANLSGAAAATLTYTYHLEEDSSSFPTEFYLDVSSTATGPWTRLVTYTVTATDLYAIPQAFDLTQFLSATTTIRFTSSADGDSDELYIDDVQIEAVPSASTEPALWFTIRDDTTSGPTGVTTLDDGAIASFDVPGISYEPGTTAGTMATVADWDDTFFTGLDLSGIHMVESAISIGDLSLLQGDILFTLDGSATLPGPAGSVSFTREDVGRFRPTNPGEYSAGEFIILLDSPLGVELRGVTLVEQATAVGEVTLPAGTFLLTRSGGSEDEDVWQYNASSAGEGSTTGTSIKLLEGTELGFSGQVWGIDLVEEGYGWPFPRGAIVLTIGTDIAGNDADVIAPRQIVSFVVSQTSVSGTARVTTILAWDGNDLGFDSNSERLDGFTFMNLDLSPKFDLDIGDRTDDEGSTVSFSASATDPRSDTLTYSATGLPAYLTIDSATGLVSGAISETAASGSPYAVQLTVTDPGGNTDIDTFTWTVNAVNTAPELILLGDQTNAEGDTVGFVWTAADLDFDTLTWSATGLPTGLSINSSYGLISGTIDYTAAAASPYLFTIRVDDDGVPPLFNEVTFSWTVSNSNRPPELVVPGDQVNAEGDSVSITASASDPDGDNVTFEAFDLPSGLVIDSGTGVISGSISFDAAAGSPHTVVVRATDDGAPVASSEATFTWTVTNVNRAPVLSSPGMQSSAEGDVVSLPVSGFDPDGDGLTWSATGLPGGLSIDTGTGVISGTLGYTSEGTHAVVVGAIDDGVPNLSDDVAFTWTVADTNRAPNITDPGGQASAEGDVISLAVSGSDPDGDGVTWTASGLPDALSIDSGSGVITGTLSYTSAGAHAVVVRATDDGSPNLFSEVAFTWTVANTNRAPVLSSPGMQFSAENDVVSLPVSGFDPDGDGLTWSATGLPAGLSIDTGTGVISGTLGYTSEGTHAVVVSAIDDGSPNLSDDVAFTWTVSNTNRAPNITGPGNQASAEGDVISLAVSGSDPDGDGITWTASGLPTGLTIDSGTGVISGTISYSAAGTHPVTVRATDDDAASLFSEVAFTWTVADTNRAPNITGPGDQASAEGDVISLAVSGSDPDGDGITWTASGLPTGLTIDSGTGVISGTISYSAAGTHPVTVGATDDGTPNLYNQITFTWTVANTNRAPIVTNPGDQATGRGDSISLPVSGSDPDDDTLTWSAAGLPAGLTISSVTGVVAGAPTTAGAFTVNVTATDDGSPKLSADATFTWTVEAPPGFPTIEVIGNQHTLVGDSVSLRPDWSHPDALSMTWSAVGLPTGLDINRATGEINGRTAAAGVFSVTVTLTDSRDQAVEASFLWSVAIPDLPPIAMADSIRVDGDAIGSGIVVDVLGNDSDPEGSALSLLSMDQPEFGTAAIVNGLVFFTPLQGWIGTVELLYTVVDETGNQTTGLLTITIEESLGMVLAAAALQYEQATPPSVSFDEIDLGIGAGAVFVLGSVVQSLYVLGFPLALFGGAVFWSLIFGGILNVGFAVKGGIPMIVRRTPRNAAVVMVAHGKKLEALSKPGKGELVCEYLATDRGLQATGRRSKNFDRRWAEIETPDGPAWVPAVFLAEQVDRVGFANDPMPVKLIEELVARMRARAPISDLISQHGLWIAHHGPIERYRRYELDSLMDDQSIRTWPGRNPAFPAFRGTFDIAVATSFLDAWEHPQRQLQRDQRAVPSTMIPVEFTNFHTVSIGADVSGRERLDLPSWLVVFAYEDDRAHIIGLVKEG